MQNIFFSESSVNLGGQEFQLIQQARELKNIYRVKLFIKPNAKIAEQVKKLDIDVFNIPFRNSVHLPSIILVLFYLIKYKPIAVICHSAHDAMVMGLAVKIYRYLLNGKTKLIRMRTYQPGIPHAWPYKYLFDVTYAPSEYLKNEILRNPKIPPDSVRVLYPGIDFSRLDNQTQASEKLRDWLVLHPGPVMCHGAMLRGEKGHLVVLDALPKILKTYPNLRYLIAGEGPMCESIIEKVHALGLSNNVCVLGHVPEISGVLRLSDLAILPSLYEPLGMFQIESQYLKVPTIASDTGGVPETIIHQKTGLLVQAGDADEWAKNIVWALDNLSTVKKWADVGKDYVYEKFSMANNTRELLKIISNMS